MCAEEKLFYTNANTWNNLSHVHTRDGGKHRLKGGRGPSPLPCSTPCSSIQQMCSKIRFSSKIQPILTGKRSRGRPSTGLTDLFRRHPGKLSPCCSNSPDWVGLGANVLIFLAENRISSNGFSHPPAQHGFRGWPSSLSWLEMEKQGSVMAFDFLDMI